MMDNISAIEWLRAHEGEFCRYQEAFLENKENQVSSSGVCDDPVIFLIKEGGSYTLIESSSEISFNVSEINSFFPANKMFTKSHQTKPGIWFEKTDSRGARWIHFFRIEDAE